MSRGVINVGLAIFARNEAERIGQLISDLGEQTLLADDRLSIHIFVVANGCTDRTADVARQAFAAPVFSRPRIGASVHELAKAGKSNAWNELVHRIAPKGTDYMFFLDADIRIPDSGSLKAVLDGLVSSPEAVVAVDRSVKDIELEQPKTLIEKLIKYEAVHDIRSWSDVKNRLGRGRPTTHGWPSRAPATACGSPKSNGYGCRSAFREKMVS